MSNTRIGIIGCGGMGKGHLHSLEHIPEAEVVALADTHAPNLQATSEIAPEARAYEDYQDLLACDDVDAVVIATPNDTHKDISIAALNADKHVLCEKPLATTAADCRAVVEAAANSDNMFQNGLELRFGRVYTRVADCLRNGDIGKLVMMWCKEIRGPFALKVEDWILQQERSGGTLNEKDCHHFDLFNWYAGSRPVRVFASGGQDGEYADAGAKAKNRGGSDPVTVIDNALVTVDYENGVRAELILCMFNAYNESLEVGFLGDDGWMQMSSSREELLVNPGDRESQVTHKMRTPPQEQQISHRGMVYHEQLDFLRCIREGDEPVVTAEVGMWSVLPALAGELSIRERRIVDIAELV